MLKKCIGICIILIFSRRLEAIQNWTLDSGLDSELESGLDYRLDYGLDYGLNFGLNWIADSVLALPYYECWIV